LLLAGCRLKAQIYFQYSVSHTEEIAENFLSFSVKSRLQSLELVLLSRSPGIHGLPVFSASISSFHGGPGKFVKRSQLYLCHHIFQIISRSPLCSRQSLIIKLFNLQSGKESRALDILGINVPLPIKLRSCQFLESQRIFLPLQVKSSFFIIVSGFKRTKIVITIKHHKENKKGQDKIYAYVC